MIQVGSILRTTINHRRTRVIVEARLEIAEHLCGDYWDHWEAWRVRNLATGRTTIKRASELKSLKEAICN